jgi:bifunctional ADP-heptose synthase (sugar kinase/adenylyltransferase)
LDTRKKILGLEEVLQRTEGLKVRWVRGSFDPLLAAHARMLEEISSADSILAVALNDPSGPLLAMRARAELVAGLRIVDYVLMDAAPPDGASIFEMDDPALGGDFEAHVRRRNERFE